METRGIINKRLLWTTLRHQTRQLVFRDLK